MKRFINFLKALILPVIILVIALVVYNVIEDSKTDVNRSNIMFISEHFNGAGKLIDYQNEVGVKSIDDIRLFIKNEEVKIKFGKILLKWKMDEFVSRENQELLDKIYIKIYRDKSTGRLRVFYQGVELERWVS